MKKLLVSFCLGTFLVFICDPSGQDAPLSVPPSGVIGVTQQMLSPEYWIARASNANRLLMTSEEIEVRNERLSQVDAAVVDLKKIGPQLTRSQVLDWIKETGAFPRLPQLNRQKGLISQTALDGVKANTAKSRIPATAPVRYGLAVKRSLLRSFPTAMEAFAGKDLLDFDSFAGGILFPGDPVVIAHTSADGEWLLVETTQGPEWVLKKDIAEGSKEQVFGYVSQKPFRVVTGDEVRTVFTPEEPRVSELQMDMGTRLPVAKLAEDQPVHGQGSYESWIIDIPLRGDDGKVAFSPALLRRTSDSSVGYLPLTRANIIRQAFKFLGERYGWGHANNARDCSGFTGDTFRSMGLVLPGTSEQQGSSPGFQHETFSAKDSHDKRVKAVMRAQVGDLLVVPGHVMMILGNVNGQPYVIQDVPFIIFREGNKTQWTKSNQVSVTPLLPLLADGKRTYVDAMTSLVHVTSH